MLHWILLAALGALAISTALSQGFAWHAEQRHPPIGEFFQIDGQRIHYTDSGQGARDMRPLLLIHGANTSLKDFEASIGPTLSERRRVVMVDRPGHGYSQRPAGGWPDPGVQARLIHKLAEHLELERPILVGHSLAGTIVLAYLLQHAEDSAGGVMLAGASHPWTGGVDWHTDLAGVPVLGTMFAYTLVGPVGRLLMPSAVDAVFLPETPTPGYRERTGIDLGLRPQSFLANAEDVRLLSPYLERQSERYETITAPILFITGSEDSIVPSWNHRDRMQALTPSVASVELEGAGHALHHTRPARVVELIESFARAIEHPGVHQAALNETVSPRVAGAAER